MAAWPAIWTFAIDRGGTFTDVVARLRRPASGSRSCCRKIPTNMTMPRWRGSAASWRRRAAALGEVRMGTTVATNALLERKGERVALAITRGFGDALRIGYQARPDIFARHIVLPAMLYETVVEIDERVGADGEVVRAARRGRAPAPTLRRSCATAAFDALAIVLMHGWRFTDHEARAGRDRARDRLHPDLGQPRGRAADQADRARRHDRRRCLSVAGPAPLRRPGRGGAAATAPSCSSCSRTAG